MGGCRSNPPIVLFFLPSKSVIIYVLQKLKGEKMEVKKTRGRPKKFLEPTYTQSFRIGQNLKEFYNQLEHANQFMIDTITSTPEFQSFLAQKRQKESKNQPSLFKEQ